jgi:putative sigma-54 modulation protein
MIKKFEITGIHTDATKDIQKYVTKKIAKLDSYMPKHARASAHADVKLKESKAKDKKACTAEVILTLPGERITAKETTVNMYAAIDIVEEKLKAQLRKYKEQSTHGNRGGRKIRQFLGKIVPKKSSL